MNGAGSHTLARARCPRPSLSERTGGITRSTSRAPSRHLCTVVRARKAGRGSDKVSLGQGESPALPSGPLDQTKVAGVAVLVAVLGAIGIARKTRRKGSVDRLVKRGMLEEYREREDPYYQSKYHTTAAIASHQTKVLFYSNKHTHTHTLSLSLYACARYDEERQQSAGGALKPGADRRRSEEKGGGPECARENKVSERVSQSSSIYLYDSTTTSIRPCEYEGFID